MAGISTCALGHADQDLAAAVSNQMSTFHHVSNLYYIAEQVMCPSVTTDTLCSTITGSLRVFLVLRNSLAHDEPTVV